MRIKEVSCQQFAGVRDRRIALEPGINVVYGANESGKSTMVNLISGTLFQNVKLSNRDKKDKAFRVRFFPSAKRGKTAIGDTIDGKIVLETNGETYTLTKEWGEDPSCTLSTPDGLIRKQDSIDALLKEVLGYGEGVYTELLLSPQSDTGKALETILNRTEQSDAKVEILNMLSQVFAESDGISADSIGEEIRKRIDDLAGKHWDESRDIPDKKAGGGRWGRDVGSVMATYYALEDAKNQRDALAEKENAAVEAEKEYQQQDSRYLQAKEEWEAFQKVANQMILREARRNQLASLQSKITKLNGDMESWPATETALARSRNLQRETRQREDLEQYQAVMAILQELEEIDRSLLKKPRPSNAEICSVQSNQRKITTLENKLCGMNLTADLKLFDGHSVEIRSIRTGEALQAEGGKVSLTEAVTITIPGVMNMVLAPANVNVAEIEESIRNLAESNAKIFHCYGVESPESLQEYAANYQKIQRRVEEIQHRAEEKLAGRTLEELKAGIVETVRTKAEIAEDVATLCGRTRLDVFAEIQEETLKKLQKEYGSISALSSQKQDMEDEIARLQNQDEEEIPEEFLSVQNPEQHLENLKSRLEGSQIQREKALTAKNKAETEWESAQEAMTEDLQQQVQEARRRFDEEKNLLRHWRHIQSVFEEEKDSIQTNPTAPLAESFARYLNLISEGSICGELPEQGKLDLAVYSKERLMDFEKLSEGTKDTVSLAYRLAVLDQLFPEGGGVIVLDDSFSDMDSQRTAQSVKLVKECAKRHQVIFLTCKEDLAQQLEGNLIRL